MALSDMSSLVQGEFPLADVALLPLQLLPAAGDRLVIQTHLFKVLGSHKINGCYVTSYLY